MLKIFIRRWSHREEDLRIRSFENVILYEISERFIILTRYILADYLLCMFTHAVASRLSLFALYLTVFLYT